MIFLICLLFTEPLFLQKELTNKAMKIKRQIKTIEQTAKIISKVEKINIIGGGGGPSIVVGAG